MIVIGSGVAIGFALGVRDARVQRAQMDATDCAIAAIQQRGKDEASRLEDADRCYTDRGVPPLREKSR